MGTQNQSQTLTKNIMFITKKTHRQITESLSKSIMEKDAYIARLKQDILEARDLKLVLEKLAASGASASNCFTLGTYGTEIRLPDTVAQYVPDVLGETIMSVRPRLSELLKLGKIADTGRTRANSSGRMATVWRAV